VGVREFFAANRRTPQLHVELADGTVYDDVFFAIIANADPWTYVGNRPLHPTPQVSFDTDLALYARRRMGMVGVLVSMVRISGNRPRVGRRGAHLVHELTSHTVRADEPMPVQVDGDYLDKRAKARFTSVTGAIRIVI
jgi:diacylglycerol kinase family enzyme